MEPGLHSWGQPLERFSAYLLVQAQMLFVHYDLGARVRSKMDPADLVQQTLLEAHRDRGQFRGGSEAELRAWLRQVLLRNFRNAVRDLGRAKRDVRREQSLDAALERSSARLEKWLVAQQASPSASPVRRAATAPRGGPAGPAGEPAGGARPALLRGLVAGGDQPAPRPQPRVGGRPAPARPEGVTRTTAPTGVNHARRQCGVRPRAPVAPGPGRLPGGRGCRPGARA